MAQMKMGQAKNKNGKRVSVIMEGDEEEDNEQDEEAKDLQDMIEDKAEDKAEDKIDEGHQAEDQ